MGAIVLTPAYISTADADTYFISRFPSVAWSGATSGDKAAALYTASEAIDKLNFAGDMASFSFTLTLQNVQLVNDTVLALAGNGVVPDSALFYLDGYTYGVVSHTEVSGRTTSITIAAPGLQVAGSVNDPLNFFQSRQFPRGTDVLIPQGILKATCELAYAYIDGADPSIEIENLNATVQGVGDARTTYDRSFAQPNVLAGIPSVQAWHYLLPFLRDPGEIRMLKDSFKLGPPQSFV